MPAKKRSLAEYETDPKTTHRGQKPVIRRLNPIPLTQAQIAAAARARILRRNQMIRDVALYLPRRAIAFGKNRRVQNATMFLPKKAYRAGAYALSPFVESYGIASDYLSPRLSPTWERVKGFAGRYVSPRLYRAVSPVWSGLGRVGSSIASGARAVHDYMTDGQPIQGPLRGTRDWIRGGMQPY